MIDHLDHIVLTTRDKDACIRFYTEVLGMRLESFSENRLALHFGSQKINLHPAKNPYSPRAKTALPGTGDLCLIAKTPIANVIEHLKAEGVDILQGPVPKSGATGPITSVYFRDPDDNLIEVSNYD